MTETQKRKFYLKEYKAISHAISTYEDLNLLIGHICEGTSRTFDAKGTSIMVLDEHEKQLVTVGSWGLSDDYLRKGPITVKDRHCAFVTGTPIWVDDLQDDDRIQYPQEAKREGIRSMLSIPIKSRREVVGVLRIYFPSTSRIADEDVDSLQVLSEQFGLVLENHGLKNFLEQVKMAMDCLPRRLSGD